MEEIVKNEDEDIGDFEGKKGRKERYWSDEGRRRHGDSAVDSLGTESTTHDGCYSAPVTASRCSIA